MSCYKCGSPEGNAARLCPACNEKRNQAHSDRIAQLSRKAEDTPVPPLTQQQKVLLGIGSALLLIGVAFLFSPSRAASPLPDPAPTPVVSPVDAAFTVCVGQALGPIDAASDPEALEHARQTCDAFSAPCKESVESEGCVSFLTKYRTAVPTVTP